MSFQFSLTNCSEADVAIHKEKIRNDVAENCLVLYTMEHCKWCDKTESIFKRNEYKYKSVVTDNCYRTALFEMTTMYTLPQTFLGGRLAGGFKNVEKLERNGMLAKLYTRCLAEKEAAKS